MTKKTADSKSSSSKTASRSNPKPATHIDSVPKKTSAAGSRAASPLHTGDDPGTMPPHTTADTTPNPDAAVANPDPNAAAASTLPEPAIDPIPAPVVPVPDPGPSAEPHQPSGADEIMRRHRLVDPMTAEVHASEAEEIARQAEKELVRRARENEEGTEETKDSKGTTS